MNKIRTIHIKITTDTNSFAVQSLNNIANIIKVTPIKDDVILSTAKDNGNWFIEINNKNRIGV